MRRAFRSVLIITVFTFSSQLVLFIVQMVTASFFGASPNMDAYLAANALPQYIISVLLGSLGFVFIPFFIDYKTRESEENAYQLASSLFNNCMFFLGIITILGMVFAKPLLQLTAPGLSPQSLEMGVKVAIITWPTILATGAMSLLSSIFQAEKKFTWQAAVPFIGAVLNLILLSFLAPWMGVVGLALATTCGVVLQVFLLMRIIAKRGKYKFGLNWNNPGVQQVFKLLAPLIFVAIATKFTPILDRYLASGLLEGSISHLNYAFKIVTVLSVLISTGAATVIFPKMALDMANSDMSALRNTMSVGLRVMWIVIAPVIAIGISVSLPLVITLFNRGQFTVTDSVAVSDILNIYLIALIAMGLGSITGKGFYALKDTKTLAILGVIEATAYAVYTIYLTRWLGVKGIAIGYVIYFNLSLLWQVFVLRKKMGNYGGVTVLKSFGKTMLAAAGGGIVAYLIVLHLSSGIIQIILGGLVGLLTYLLALRLLRSYELNLLTEMFSLTWHKEKGP